MTNNKLSEPAWKVNYNKYSKRSGRLSEEYKSEKEFQKHIAEVIDDIGFQISPSDVNVYMKPDIVLQVGQRTIMIELKVSTRKTSLAKALGQSIIYREYDLKNIISIICVPSDCVCETYFKRTAERYNIFVCDENNIKTVINSTIHKIL